MCSHVTSRKELSGRMTLSFDLLTLKFCDVILAPFIIACRVSSTSAQRSRSLGLLNMLTPHLTGFMSSRERLVHGPDKISVPSKVAKL